MARPVPVPAERRHTLAFLHSIQSASPVYLDAEVDVSGLTAHQRSAQRKYSVVSYVMKALGEVLPQHPVANSAFVGGWWPRLLGASTVDVKLALDKTVNDTRSVLSVVLADVGARSLDELQDEVERLRDTAAADLPELAGARTLQRLPVALGRAAFAFGTRLATRQRVMGTVALSSLGHAPVHRFFSYGGTPITIGVGRIVRKPVVVPGIDGTENLEIRSILPLSLTFDHRVLDGAAGAEVLADLTHRLGAHSW